jgi:hypothetical protein
MQFAYSDTVFQKIPLDGDKEKAENLLNRVSEKITKFFIVF